MNLLIVDDMLSVVEGLQKGIDWTGLGFEQVFGVCSARQARSVMENYEISVLLTDIEMPGENGLQLQAWVQENAPQVVTIFLTSHADFEFARQAIRLNSFDYILQPAAYADVEKSVRNAVEHIKNTQVLNEEISFGRQMKGQAAALCSSCIIDMLYGNTAGTFYRELLGQKLLPMSEDPVYLLLIQADKSGELADWPTDLLAFTISNILTELLETYQVKVWVLPVGRSQGRMCALIENKFSDDELYRNLSLLSMVLRTYMKGDLLIYAGRKGSFGEVESTWREICQYADEDVLQQPGIYDVSRSSDEKHMHQEDIGKWLLVLQSTDNAELKTVANEVLDRLIGEHALDRQNLLLFFSRFVHVVRSAAPADYLEQCLDTEEKQRIYRNAASSVTDMRKLIDLLTDGLKKTEKRTEAAVRVEQIKDYIENHLDEDLRMEDIGRVVSLSPDHMARVFKAETGVTLKEYIIQRRMETARNLLHGTSLSVSTVALRVGYSNFSYFSSCYRKTFGVSPQADRG